MGWWRTDAGDVIGDEPADVASNELDAISEMLLEKRAQRLSLGELLGYLHVVIRTKARELLGPDDDGQIAALAADLEIYEEDENRRVRIEMVTPSDDSIRDRVDHMCERISAHYMESVEGRPTLRELLAQVRFVLGYKPVRYLDVPSASGVVHIHAIPEAAGPE